MGGKKPNPFSGCTWESLAEHIAPEVLHAPKIGGEWPAVHERIVRYLPTDCATRWEQVAQRCEIEASICPPALPSQLTTIISTGILLSS